MDLYFSPLACSLASRIGLYEAGLDARYIRVNTRTKQTDAGGDFLSVNAKGQVPTLTCADGAVVTENAAVLEYLADQAAPGVLAPAGDRRRFREWISFISSELHTPTFGALLSPTAADAVKAHAKARIEPKLAWLNAQLEGRDFLLDQFSLADAYLATVMNWTQATGIDLAAYPNLAAHRARVFARPAAGKAFQEELALYQAA